jgi:hypothetical protein
VLTIIRDDVIANPTAQNNTANKTITPISWADLSQIQIYHNQLPYWSEPILGSRLQVELYDEAKKSQKQISSSLYYQDYSDSALARTQNQIPLFLSFSSAPRFSDELDSGVKSNRHTTDSYMDITYNNTPTGLSNFASMSWLNASGRIYLGSSGALTLDN